VVLSGLKEPVEGIAITGQGDGCWLVDENGGPAGDAILWNDGRAVEILRQWRSDGLIEEAFRISGSVAYPGLSNAILRWLEIHKPEHLRSARHLLSCTGWLYAQLTEQMAAGLSDASNPFTDVRRCEYSDILLRLYGTEHFRALLPEIVRGADAVSPLTQRAAEELGIAPGIPVVMAPYDIVTTAFGSGAASTGQACLILGTTICAETFTADLSLDGEPAGTTVALASDLHLRAMPTLTGCETLEWAARTLGVNDIAGLERLAIQAKWSGQDVRFLPYLSPAGERAPFLEPAASGLFYGLKLTHGPAELARAVYAGLSFAIHECLELAARDVAEVRVCGGGARSDFWCQMIADVTGLEVLRPAEKEAGARGAYLFALVSQGKEPDITTAFTRTSVAVDRFIPAPTRERWVSEYARFRSTRDVMRDLWRAEEVRQP
jgi:xylulokinase